MTVFSFHPVKHVTTGEGGVITTNSKRLYERLKTLRNHGVLKDARKAWPWYYEMRDLGFNYRITDFQCALGTSQLKKIDTFVEKRRKITRAYDRAFKDNEYFDVPPRNDYTRSSWHLYYILLKGKNKSRRGRIFRALRRKAIGVQVHYIPVYLQPYYRALGYRRGICPRAEGFYQRVISIPLYPTMSNPDVMRVIKAILSVVKKG